MLGSDATDPGRIDIAGVANQRIWNFVHQPANVDLRAGTGYYSTPFRGGLFGEVEAAAVARQRATRSVDVLWLGANPCVPGSLENILNARAGRSDFPSFEKQRHSGLFGSARWGPNGEPQADFNPIQTPSGNWTVYRDLFRRVGSLESVAMANFIPWGSQNMETLIARLGAANRPFAAARA